MRRLALGSRKGKRRLRPLVRLRVGEQRPLFRSTPEENRGRNTTTGVRGGFAPSGHSQVSSENLLS